MSLISNAVYIPEDDVYLVSTSRDHHDSHAFRDACVLTVDGGLEFTHRAGRTIPELYALYEAKRYEEWALTDDMPFEVIADRMLWQTAKGWRPIKTLGAEELTFIATHDAKWPALVAEHHLARRDVRP